MACAEEQGAYNMYKEYETVKFVSLLVEERSEARKHSQQPFQVHDQFSSGLSVSRCICNIYCQNSPKGGKLSLSSGKKINVSHTPTLRVCINLRTWYFVQNFIATTSRITRQETEKKLG